AHRRPRARLGGRRRRHRGRRGGRRAARDRPGDRRRGLPARVLALPGAAHEKGHRVSETLTKQSGQTGHRRACSKVMVTENTASAEERSPELKRVMGPKLLYFFVIGDVLGTGIYALTGSVAAKVGGALWLPFVLAFVVAFLTAFAYLELVGKYPRA